MGKPAKGGFPAAQPKVNYVQVKKGEIDDATIVWGDSVVWVNNDATDYTLAASTGGVPDPAKVWVKLTGVGTDDANSSPMVFTWQAGMSKDPQTYQYGMLPPGTGKATLIVKVSA